MEHISDCLLVAEDATFAFDPDGAYWVDGIDVRAGDRTDPATFGMVDASSGAALTRRRPMLKMNRFTA